MCGGEEPTLSCLIVRNKPSLKITALKDVGTAELWNSDKGKSADQHFFLKKKRNVDKLWVGVVKQLSLTRQVHITSSLDGPVVHSEHLWVNVYPGNASGGV